MEKKKHCARSSAGAIIFVISLLGLGAIFVNDWISTNSTHRMIANATPVEPEKSLPAAQIDVKPLTDNAPNESPAPIVAAERPHADDPWETEKARIQANEQR